MFARDSHSVHSIQKESLTWQTITRPWHGKLPLVTNSGDIEWITRYQIEASAITLLYAAAVYLRTNRWAYVYCEIAAVAWSFSGEEMQVQAR